MAFNWNNALQGAVRGAAPGVAASVDQGKNLDSLIKSREFQDLINQARLAKQKQDMQYAEEDRALLTPEERKQKMLDPAGYRQLRNKSTAAVDAAETAVDAAESVGKIAKARSEFGDDIPDNVARFFDDSTNEVVKPYEKSAVDIVAEAFGSGKGQDDAAISAADKKARAALIERGMAEDDEQASAMVLDAVGKMPGFSQRPDNRGMFSGESFVQQAQAPKTFGELGISDPQSQQTFSEIEAKVPGLRELFASDPEAFQRLFAAVNSGKLTQAEAITLIEQSQQP